MFSNAFLLFDFDDDKTRRPILNSNWPTESRIATTSYTPYHLQTVIIQRQDDTSVFASHVLEIWPGYIHDNFPPCQNFPAKIQPYLGVG